MAAASQIKCIPLDVVKSFVKNCCIKSGAKEEHASDLADLLVAADHRGHFSHGLNRLEIYVNDLLNGLVCKENEPVIEKETVSTALVNGNNLLGPAIGKFCMKLAIKKAKQSGVGMVTVHNSNHYGIAGYYSLMASDAGFIGMSFTNTTPLVLHPCSKNSGISGSNPISFATPGSQKSRFSLDMATSTVSRGKVEVKARKGSKMPRGWGADTNGNETDEPSKVLNGGGLLPLGGCEESGGYKGYGLALMVEILCSILSGAAFATNIRRWGDLTKVANLGQCFLAIDPSVFAPGFDKRLDELLNLHRNQPLSDPEKPILIAGDPERLHMKKCSELGGVPYPSQVVDYMNSVGAKLSIDPMTSI